LKRKSNTAEASGSAAMEMRVAAKKGKRGEKEWIEQGERQKHCF
jgi:hypothetical protein